MSEVQVVEETTDERYRVILVQDEDAQQPYDDSSGYVFDVDWSNSSGYAAELLHAPTGDPFADELASSINEALRRWGTDWDTLERYLRIFHDAVSLDWYDRRSGGRLLCVVTRGQCEAWGVPSSYWAETADLREWRDYDEGSVYGFVIQERVLWTTEADYEDREAWEDTDDSCFGLYGLEYAQEAAKEALAAMTAQQQPQQCHAARTGEGYWTCDIRGGCSDCRTLASEVNDEAQLRAWQENCHA